MTHRIIYSLSVQLMPRPEDPPGHSRWMCIPLGRDWQSLARNGRPRHKARTIDLRVGDELMADGRWSTIKSIEADRQNWITDERAANLEGNDGYVYLLPGETRTPEEMRKAT